MPFNEFNNLTFNKVDWFKLTNGIYKVLNSTIRLTSKELVIVSHIPYYKGLIKLLKRKTNRVIANYFGWSFGSYTVEKFREIQFQFNKTTSGIQKTVRIVENLCLYCFLGS